MCVAPEVVNLDNPIDVIRFVVDNNPDAVRNQLSQYGQNRGGLTPCLMKDLIISMYNQGYNIRPLMMVPYNPNADNYTTQIMSMGKWNWGAIGDFFQNVGNTIGQYVAGAATGLGGLGAQGAGGAGPRPDTPAATDYTPYLIGGSVLVVLVVLVLLFKK